MVVADLANAAGVDRVTSEVLTPFGKAPDTLINNLGLAHVAPFEDLSEALSRR